MQGRRQGGLAWRAAWGRVQCAEPGLAAWAGTCHGACPGPRRAVGGLVEEPRWRTYGKVQVMARTCCVQRLQGRSASTGKPAPPTLPEGLASGEPVLTSRPRKASGERGSPEGLWPAGCRCAPECWACSYSCNVRYFFLSATAIPVGSLENWLPLRYLYFQLKHCVHVKF